MGTVTLTFDSVEERSEALAAVHAMSLASALGQIDGVARSALKHDGDQVAALEKIRVIACAAIGGLE